MNEERNIDVEDGAKEEVKFTPEETKLLEDQKASNLKKMNKTAKAKYTAKKEAQAEAEKIKAELAVAAKLKKQEEAKAKRDEAKAKREAYLDKLNGPAMARTMRRQGLG